MRLLGDVTRQEAGWALAPVGSTSLLLPCRAVPARAGEERKSADRTFPDSYPSRVRREPGGFRLGCVPTGKAHRNLSQTTWGPIMPQSGAWAAVPAWPSIRLSMLSKLAMGRHEAVVMTVP